MAFAYTVDNNGIPNTIGDKKFVTGTFTNGTSDTGGTISTGLRRIYNVTLTHTGTAVVASAPVVNGAFPIDSSDFVIVTVADADGVWTAYGE